jgi:hypothetical protein
MIGLHALVVTGSAAAQACRNVDQNAVLFAATLIEESRGAQSLPDGEGISQFDLAQPLRGEKIYRVVTQARGVGSA